MSERCILYIDGYNFYYAIKNHPDTTPIYLGWCDFGALARQFMIESNASLSAIKYFTAPVGRLGASGGPAGGEAQRQQLWLDAVSTIPQLEIIYGCYTGDTPRARKEKQTDVNLAVAMVSDAALDKCDRALLLTGDLDQTPAVAAATEFGKRVDVWIPPNQHVGSWAAVSAYPGARVRKLTPQMLRASRLPERWTKEGSPMEAPKMWRAPSQG
jgi:uncharacterized LabA/DUF88 family protein